MIRVTAIALAARADRAAQLRAAGDAAGAAAEAAAGAALLGVAREGASYPARPKAVLGPEGRGWLARCEAEYARLTGANSPERLGAGARRVRARLRVRDRAHPVAAGRGAGGSRPPRRGRRRLARGARYRVPAAGGAPRRGPRRPGPPRPPRPGHGTGAGTAADQAAASPLAALTDREREVLSLLARGMSNREIGTELFITPKTASVHVSNILGKLGAASRTEAAAIAYREGA